MFECVDTVVANVDLSDKFSWPVSQEPAQASERQRTREDSPAGGFPDSLFEHWLA